MLESVKQLKKKISSLKNKETQPEKTNEVPMKTYDEQDTPVRSLGNWVLIAATPMFAMATSTSKAIPQCSLQETSERDCFNADLLRNCMGHSKRNLGSRYSQAIINVPKTVLGELTYTRFDSERRSANVEKAATTGGVLRKESNSDLFETRLRQSLLQSCSAPKRKERRCIVFGSGA